MKTMTLFAILFLLVGCSDPNSKEERMKRKTQENARALQQSTTQETTEEASTVQEQTTTEEEEERFDVRVFAPSGNGLLFLNDVVLEGDWNLPIVFSDRAGKKSYIKGEQAIIILEPTRYGK